MVIDVDEARALLASGEIVAIPTETVWGLAVRADDPQAVARLRALKPRGDKPLSLFPESLDKISDYAVITEPARKLMEKGFVPGPLVMVLEAARGLDGVVAGDNSVGIRVPDHPEVLDLLSRLSFPLATTSANPPGRAPAVSSAELSAYFPGLPSLRGEARGAPASTVVDARHVPLSRLRRGPVGLLEMGEAAGARIVARDLRVLFVCSGGVDRSPHAARYLASLGLPGLETLFVGTLWPLEDIRARALWADIIYPLEKYHEDFLEDMGIPSVRIKTPLGIPDPHGLDEDSRARIFSFLESVLLSRVVPEIRQYLARD